MGLEQSCTLEFYTVLEDEFYDLLNLPIFYSYWGIYQLCLMTAAFFPEFYTFADFWKYQYLYGREMNLSMAYARYSDQEWMNIFNFGFGVMFGDWWCIMWQYIFLGFNWMHIILVWDNEWTDLWEWMRDFAKELGFAQKR